MFPNKIVHTNHGVTATRFDGSKVHNSCFFLSVAASMNMDYESVFNLGSFPESARGHMVDTWTHRANINQLATSLQRRIAIHTGQRCGEHIFVPDVVAAMVFPIVYGVSPSDHWEVINIVHVSEHFMTFASASETAENEAIAARIAEEEAATAALIAAEAVIAARMEARRIARVEEERIRIARNAEDEAATIAFLIAEGLIPAPAPTFLRV
jgi:hypothetical protein